MIELRALGPFDLRDDRGALQAILAQRKRGALLVYLTLARPRGYHPRDPLMAMFWPEADQRRARNSLSQSLTYLRRELPGEVLVTRGAGVKVDPAGLWADVVAFEEAVAEARWEDALALYRGELLAGFHVSDAPAFERWLDVERDRLRELAAKAAWSRARERIGAGDPVEAERAAQRALLLAPTDETPVREFIEELAASGERAAALSFYERFHAVLEDVLDVAPAPETTAVATAIRGDAASATVPGPGTRAARPVRRSRPAGARVDPGAGPPPASREEDGASPARRPPSIRRSRRHRVVRAVAAVLILASITSVRTVRTPEPAAPRVMVLAFENRTGDPSLDPVGQMAADWISNAVLQVPGVEVVPRELIARRPGGADGRGESPVPTDAAEATGATMVVTGAFYRRGEGLEFHTRLVELASAEPIAAIHPVRGPAADPMHAIDSVRSQVLGALATRTTPLISLELPPGTQPPGYHAYLAFLQGMQFWLNADFVPAARWFEEAYARDTTYLRALNWTWAAHMNAGLPEAGDSVRAFLRARRDRLSRYDQYWLDVYDARTHGDHAAFLTAARGAVELNPIGPLRLALVGALIDNNRPVEAREQLEDWLAKLPAVVPRWGPARVQHANVLHLVGDYRAELDIARRHRAELPTGSLPLALAEARARAALGELEAMDRAVADLEATGADGLLPIRALAELAMELRAHGHRAASLERTEQALRWHARLPATLRDGRSGRELRAMLLYGRERWREAGELWAALERDARGVGLIQAVGRHGAAAARIGDRATAEGAMRRLATLGLDAPAALGGASLERARIRALLGDVDRAVALLRKSFTQGQAFGIWLHRDMDLERLRGDPAFEAFVAPGG